MTLGATRRTQESGHDAREARPTAAQEPLLGRETDEGAGWEDDVSYNEWQRIFITNHVFPWSLILTVVFFCNGLLPAGVGGISLGWQDHEGTTIPSKHPCLLPHMIGILKYTHHSIAIVQS
jgi:hypothetical protein